MKIPTRVMIPVIVALACPPALADDGFVKVFDGKSLDGWLLFTEEGNPGFVVEDGLLVCPPGEKNSYLFLDRQYSDFVFKYKYRLAPEANNGFGFRSALPEDPNFYAPEIQILDDRHPSNHGLQPNRRSGSLYNIVAPTHQRTLPAGHWNSQTITAVGRHITVDTNGYRVLDTNINDITDPQILKDLPGILRDTGYLGFKGHKSSRVELKDIYVKDLSQPESHSTPPPGFRALFNGKDLTGWKGLVANPPERARMSPEKLAEAQQAADQKMRDHWKAVDGVLTYDGRGDSICTAEDFGNFELLIDWKIEPGGDSGIYLRGSPQVQIWDDPVGSGGLYNNQQNPSTPAIRADNPTGEWNRFRILMVDDTVSVFLNNKLVVKTVVMENLWERGLPIYPTGQIELQNHYSPLYFRNIYIRTIERR